MHYEYCKDCELANMELRDDHTPTPLNTDNVSTDNATPQPNDGTDQPSEISEISETATRIRQAHASQLRMNLQQKGADRATSSTYTGKKGMEIHDASATVPVPDLPQQQPPQDPPPQQPQQLRTSIGKGKGLGIHPSKKQRIRVEETTQEDMAPNSQPAPTEKDTLPLAPTPLDQVLQDKIDLVNEIRKSKVDYAAKLAKAATQRANSPNKKKEEMEGTLTWREQGGTQQLIGDEIQEKAQGRGSKRSATPPGPATKKKKDQKFPRGSVSMYLSGKPTKGIDSQRLWGGTKTKAKIRLIPRSRIKLTPRSPSRQASSPDWGSTSPKSPHNSEQSTDRTPKAPSTHNTPTNTLLIQGMDKPMAASFRAWFKDEKSLIYHDQDKKEIRAIFNTVQEAIEAKQKLENKKVSYAIHYTEDITELASGSGHSKPEELLENPPQDDLLTNSILRIVNLHLTRQQLYEDDELEKLTMLENLIVRYTVGICYNTKTWEELTTRLRPFELTADTNTLIKQLQSHVEKVKKSTQQNPATKSPTAPSKPTHHPAAPLPKARPTGNPAKAAGARYNKSKQYCKYMANEGKCRFGTRCWFTHEIAPIAHTQRTESKKHIKKNVQEEGEGDMDAVLEAWQQAERQPTTEEHIYRTVDLFNKQIFYDRPIGDEALAALLGMGPEKSQDIFEELEKKKIHNATAYILQAARNAGFVKVEQFLKTNRLPLSSKLCLRRLSVSQQRFAMQNFTPSLGGVAHNADLFNRFVLSFSKKGDGAKGSKGAKAPVGSGPERQYKSSQHDGNDNGDDKQQHRPTATTTKNNNHDRRHATTTSTTKTTYSLNERRPRTHPHTIDDDRNQMPGIQPAFLESFASCRASCRTPFVGSDNDRNHTSSGQWVLLKPLTFCRTLAKAGDIHGRQMDRFASSGSHRSEWHLAQRPTHKAQGASPYTDRVQHRPKNLSRTGQKT